MQENRVKRNYKREQLNQILDDELNQLILKKRHFCVKTKTGGYLLSVRFNNVKSPRKGGEQILFYVDQKQLILVSESKKCQKIMDDIFEEEIPSVQLLNFFSTLVMDDIDILNDLEEQITSLEDRLLENKKIAHSVIEEIVRIRRKLLRMKQYYEQLESVMDLFMEHVEESTNENLAHKYQMLSRRLEQYLNLIQNLRELVVQVREVYQSQVDMEQNKLMKIFTVITTIFTPLTLITGWYGMNFYNMPELQWENGYLYVILLAIGISGLSALFFKLKGWFK